MHKTKRILGLLVVCVFAFGLCSISAQIAPRSEKQAVNNLETLTGCIGQYPITMQIDLENGNEGQYIGYYYYNSRPNNKFRLKLVKMEAINLSGSMKVVLKEFTPAGKNTGTFNGQYECRGSYYAGTFTNSHGQKFKFELE